MKEKTILLTFCILLLFSINFVSAITGSIGNARMILRVEPGDVVEKYILVKNVNDDSLNISLFSSGDLTEDIVIHDESFILLPKQEKKAYFTITVKEAGTTQSNINVKFTPIDGGNGVGLSSTIIVDAQEASDGDGGDNLDSGVDLDNDLVDDVDDGNALTGNAIWNPDWKINSTTLWIVLEVVVFTVLLIFFLMLIFNKDKLNSKKKSEKSE